MHDGCAPAAEMFIGQMERCDLWVLFQNGVDGLAQLADALAVNDAYPQDSARPTLCQIVQHEVLHLARLERVQVQHPVNRQLDWFIVHKGIQPRMAADEHGFPRSTGVRAALRYAARG